MIYFKSVTKKQEKKHTLNETDWPRVSIINYKGTLVEKIIGGFKIWGRVVATAEEVDEIINKGYEWIGKSIKE